MRRKLRDVREVLSTELFIEMGVYLD